MTQHFAPKELLLDYAAGNLSEAENLVLASYLSLNPECRKACDLLEHVGGCLLEEGDYSDSKPAYRDALLNVLDKIDRLEAEGQLAEGAKCPEDVPECKILPHVLRRAIRTNVHGLQWKKIGKGIESALVVDGKTGGAYARLMRVAPGVTVPAHTHSGTEMTVVLAGGFTDGGQIYERGDISVIDDQNHDHNPFVHSVEPCICLFSCTGKLKLQGFWGRLLSPFMPF